VTKYITYFLLFRFIKTQLHWTCRPCDSNRMQKSDSMATCNGKFESKSLLCYITSCLINFQTVKVQ